MKMSMPPVYDHQEAINKLISAHSIFGKIAYDFNNRVRHSVRNNGRQHRVNIFIDYYANPGLVIANPFDVSAPIFEKRTPVIN